MQRARLFTMIVISRCRRTLRVSKEQSDENICNDGNGWTQRSIQLTLSEASSSMDEAVSSEVCRDVRRCGADRYAEVLLCVISVSRHCTWVLACSGARPGIISDCQTYANITTFADAVHAWRRVLLRAVGKRLAQRAVLWAATLAASRRTGEIR